MEQNAARLRKGGAVTIAVPGSAREYVDTFRQRYDPAMAHIMPHITLAFAQELDTADWMLARPRIHVALSQITPFEIHVSRVATFADGLVMWLQPTDEHGELVMLRQTILELLPGVAFDRIHDFVPHISIGFFASHEVLDEARAAVQRELVPFSFAVSAVSFLQADQGNVWQCVDAVPLGRSAEPDSCL
jgi:2'-5' RNA ligase